MVTPVLNREMVLFLLIVTGKFAAHFILFSLTSIISSAHDIHSKSDEESRLLSGLLEPWGSLTSSGSDFVFLDANVTNNFINLIISVAWSAFLFVWVNCVVVVCTGVVTVSVTMVCFVVFIWLFEIPSIFLWLLIIQQYGQVYWLKWTIVYLGHCDH